MAQAGLVKEGNTPVGCLFLQGLSGGGQQSEVSIPWDSPALLQCLRGAQLQWVLHMRKAQANPSTPVG